MFTATQSPPTPSLPPSPAPSGWPRFMLAAAQQDYLPAEAGLESARRQGYTHWYIDGSLEGERPTDFSAVRLRQLRGQIERTGMQPIYHGNFKSPLGSDVPALADAALDYARREVDLCHLLGNVPLIVHGGGVVEPRRVREARARGQQRLIANLTALVDYAAARGVQVWLENLCNYTHFHPFYYICTTTDEVAEVLEAVPGLHFFLDVSHAHVNNSDPLGMFHRCAPRTIGMSFSDNNGTRDSHLPLGQGTLAFGALLTAIDAQGWQGLIGFETRGAALQGSLAHLAAMSPCPLD